MNIQTTSLMKPGDVATALNISPSTLRRMRLDGSIRSVRIRGQHRFRPEDVQALIARGESKRNGATGGRADDAP